LNFVSRSARVNPVFDENQTSFLIPFHVSIFAIALPGATFELMTQSQQLQTPSATPWGSQEVRALSSRAPPTTKFKQNKEKSTSFFVRSTFAGGMAGCAVTPSSVVHKKEAHRGVIGKNFDRSTGSDKDLISDRQSAV